MKATMKANKKFENAQRIKQGLIETWELCRKHFYPEGRRIRYRLIIPKYKLCNVEVYLVLLYYASKINYCSNLLLAIKS
jgi:hypothetical protein